MHSLYLSLKLEITAGLMSCGFVCVCMGGGGLRSSTVSWVGKCLWLLNCDPVSQQNDIPYRFYVILHPTDKCKFFLFDICL